MSEKEEIQQESESGETEEILDLDREAEPITATVKLPRKDLKELGHKAINEGISRGEAIRKAVKEYIGKGNPKIAKINDKEINEILEDCTKEDGNFEIDGEAGFIQKFGAKEWKLSDLTPEQWEKVSEKLEIGYNGYWSKPEPSEFAEKFAELEPSEEQTAWLSGETEAEITESKTT
jgi:hypothetical protein